MVHLGGISPEVFLRDYWQKKPLLVRGALSGVGDLIGPDDLAGLACEEHVESRLVLEKGKRPWQVMHGPFQEDVFRRLPATHWSLLVQQVDRRVPAVARLLDEFRFIPNWRLDDIMISYAPDQGSVGPHVDNYDVFLLQGRGQRLWRVGDKALAGDEFVPELDLRILREFHPAHEWLLSEGDMLYLPPRIAHHGIAVGEAVTISIGFRAPSHGEVLEDFGRFAKAALAEEGRYSDPDLVLQREPGEITNATVKKFQAILASAVANEPLVRRWLGAMLTAPKDEFRVEISKKLTVKNVATALTAGKVLARLEGGRIVYTGAPEPYLFCEGEKFALTDATAFLGPLLSRAQAVSKADCAAIVASPAALALITELVNCGYFYLTLVDT